MCHPLQSAAAIRKRGLLLCYITDRKQISGTEAEKQHRLLAKIVECAAAGIDYIQLREKDLSPRELDDLASRAVAALPKGSPTRLLINGRTDIALACGAHGVHLPGGDLPASEVRVIWMKACSSPPVIGVSAHSITEIAVAESHGADFAVFGPVFAKLGTGNPSGLEQLRLACNRPHQATPPMPVLALGGVTVGNAAECIAAGAAGIAAIRLFQENAAETVVRTIRRAALQANG
jgi:thiamine-phosphate pyrophosphorylase